MISKTVNESFRCNDKSFPNFSRLLSCFSLPVELIRNKNMKHAASRSHLIAGMCKAGIRVIRPKRRHSK